MNGFDIRHPPVEFTGYPFDLSSMSFQYPSPVPHEEQHRTVVLVAYLLGAIGMFTAFVPILIALVICYVKRAEAVGTIYESHYRWLISTFWIGIVWFCIAVVLFIVGIGFVLYWVLCAWLIYRFVKGLLRFSERKAVV